MAGAGDVRSFVSRRGSALVAAVCLALLLMPAAMVQQATAQEAAIGTWELLSDGDGPAGRSDHTLAADEKGENLLVFGGRDAAGNALGDTWMYEADKRAWHEVKGTGPAARFGQGVVVDQEARVLYLFGGEAGSTFYDDTWRFDFKTKAWEQIETSAGPNARYGHSAVLDGDGRLVISHGFTFEGRFDDTWALDLESGTWTDISPDAGATRPLPRCLHEAIWDTAGERMLLFGGCASGFGPCPLGDLWAFDPAARAWTELTPEVGPAARTNPALVFDGDGARAVLLAGSTGAGYAFDAWTLDLSGDGATWAEQALAGDGPAARGSLDATVLRGRIYFFGGIGDAGTFADLWMASIERG